jgi:PAS domain S-box-containing protein
MVAGMLSGGGGGLDEAACSVLTVGGARYGYPADAATARLADTGFTLMVRRSTGRDTLGPWHEQRRERLVSLRHNSNGIQGTLGEGETRVRFQAQAEELHGSEESFRLLVEGVKDYAIFMLDPGGRISSWNVGARRMKGYRAGEVLGRHFSVFYSPEDIERGHPGEELRLARERGQFEEEGWRVRKDGSHFWASVLITALLDEEGKLRGFAKVGHYRAQGRRGASEAPGPA